MFYDKIGSVYNYDTLKGTNLDVIIFLKEKTLQVEASLKHRIVSFNYKILATPTKKTEFQKDVFLLLKIIYCQPSAA